jgi:predicted DNA-binding protein
MPKKIYKSKLTPIYMRMPIELKEKLNKKASKLNLSFAGYVNKILKAYLDKNEES